MKAKIGITLIFAVFLVVWCLGNWQLWPVNFSSAQTTIEQQQADLQNQLQDLENQISALQQDLKTVQGQKNTLQNKIKQLANQKATLELKIKATNLQANSVNLKIDETQSSIEKNISQSEKIKGQIAALLQLINQNGDFKLLYVILGSQSWSDFYNELEYSTQILGNLNDLLGQLKDLKAQLQKDADTLSQKKEEIQNLQSIQNLQKQGLADSVSQQKDLLTQTKGQESLYQSNLKDAQKKVQAIKTRLYSLLEVQKQINFGQAVQIAQWASAQSGVRPAFLLAILTQESNLGRNVGTCNRAGDPPAKSYKVIMNPTRDIPPFLEITQALGLNSDVTPVSCPMRDKNGNRIGWGGAMGPAQFIPSTWKGYSSKVSAITGKTADPWDIRDAFLAAALKLAAGGATSQSGEWAAAMRYFSGSTNPKYSFYGDNVVTLAEKYQADIDQLN